MVPSGTGKPEKMQRHFPVREFYQKYWKIGKNKTGKLKKKKKILEKSGKFVSQ